MADQKDVDVRLTDLRNASPERLLEAAKVTFEQLMRRPPTDDEVEEMRDELSREKGD